MTGSLLSQGVKHRHTRQRQLLLKVLGQTERHVDAYELYQRARHQQAQLSLSTVYRSLRLFKELGLVEEHQFDGARSYWEARPRARHHHMVCLGCGRIVEFHCPETERLKSRISREKGFQVTETEVRLMGYCLACQERLAGDRSQRQVTQTIARR